MFMPGFDTSTRYRRCRETLSSLLAPLALWICVSVSLRYSYYRSTGMVLGPSSSRLVRTSPIFVKQIEVKEEAKKGVLIYGFDQRPELRLETKWNVSKYLIVGSYSQQGFSLWMNEGSRIRIRWEAPSTSLDNLRIKIIKGEQNFQTLSPKSSASSKDIPSSKQTGCEEADYVIQEDDKYYVSVVNTNPRSIIMTMNVNVSSKMYDTANASSVCSTMNGSCKLNLLFPSTQFVILTTPNNADLVGWYLELSFVSRIVTYVAILGIVLIFIFLILKYIGACNEVEEFGTTTHEIFVPRRVEQTESDPLMPEKPAKLTYGTGEEDPEAGSSSSSSDELYDGKICVICYDEPRNCFFVPCGHCATCYDCAQRIMEGENRACPICRRLIHKLRKLCTS